jgi:hypothetical protein
MAINTMNSLKKDKILIIPDTNVIHNPKQLEIKGLFKDLYEMCTSKNMADMGIVHTVIMEVNEHLKEHKLKIVEYTGFFDSNLSKKMEEEIPDVLINFLLKKGYKNLGIIEMYKNFEDIEKMSEHPIITYKSKNQGEDKKDKIKNNINDYFIFQSIKYNNKNTEYEEVYFFTDDNVYIENNKKLEKEFNDYNSSNYCKLHIRKTKDKDLNNILKELDIGERLFNKFILDINYGSVCIFQNDLNTYNIKLTSINIDKLIELFSDSSSFDDAKKNFFALQTIIPQQNYTKTHIKDIIIAYITNYNKQIQGINFPNITFYQINSFIKVCDKVKLDSDDIYDLCLEHWKSLYKKTDILRLIKSVIQCEISFSQQQKGKLTEEYKKHSDIQLLNLIKEFDNQFYNELSKIELTI